MNLAEALAFVGKDLTYATVIVKDGQAKMVKAVLPEKALRGLDALEDEILDARWGEIAVELDDGRPVACRTEKHVKVEE